MSRRAMSLCWRRAGAKRKPLRPTAVAILLNLVNIGVGSAFLSGSPVAADTLRDVQLIGLAPLYEALFAVANCSNLAMDGRRFARVASLYHLSAADLTADGRFPTEITELADQYRIRLDDDRAAFCSVNRLSFSIPYGILIDRGPVFPHPLPFGHDPAN